MYDMDVIKIYFAGVSFQTDRLHHKRESGTGQAAVLSQVKCLKVVFRNKFKQASQIAFNANTANF
jgi:hypothetical protein